MGNPGLGIDAGGTQTRWALADAAGAIVAEGAVDGMSATQMGLSLIHISEPTRPY